MKIERNARRSGAHKARRYNVSPAARAIRSVLTLSAAALAFSGTGLALAKTPSAPAAIGAPRATLADQALQLPATVFDLTRVRDDALPLSVVDDGFDAFAQTFDAPLAFAADPQASYMGAVEDLTTLVPGTFHNGPGGVSGSDNVVLGTVSLPGGQVLGDGANAYSATSTTGFADGWFVSASGNTTIINNTGQLDITGATWAAGVEAEIFGVATLEQNGVINAIATGVDGAAFGVYVNGQYGAGITNNGTLDAEAVNDGGYAFGAYAFSYMGDASAANVGTIRSHGDANAFGLLATSINGDAAASNSGSGSIQVDAEFFAVGLNAYSVYGDANVDNSETLVVNGGTYAYGGRAISLEGTATAHNSGDISASAYNYGVGLLAEGVDAVTTNTGILHASAQVGRGFGLLAVGDDTASATNSGLIGVSSTHGVAYGIYASAGGVDGTTVYNAVSGIIEADSTYGDALGIYANGARVDIDNLGGVYADGYGFAAGVFAAGNDVDVQNGGTIVANAAGADGLARGVFATGAEVSVTNGGGILAHGADAMGIQARGGNVIVDNNGFAGAYGTYATAIIATSTSDGGIAAVESIGDVRAEGEVFASGIEAIARAYQGTASVTSSGLVSVESQYGSVQGLVAAADLDASVTNAGRIDAIGGSSAYAILGLSADGDVIVDSSQGDIFATASARGSIAYGVAAQSNNGHVQVDTGGWTYAIGENATGVYASTKWNDVDVTNDGQMIVIATGGDGMGIQAITYTGTSTVTNTGMLYTVGGYSGVGMWSISLYGDAIADNSGDLDTFGGVLDRGVLSRTLFGGTASIVNSGDITTYSGASSYGAWARSDTGMADVDNSGSIHSVSVFGYGYAVVAGGRTGVDVTNAATGSLYAYGGYSAAGILAYSNGGDTGVTNAGDITAVSYYGAAGIRASAAGNVAIDNTGATRAYGTYGNAFGIDAGAGGDVQVTSDGTLIAHTLYGDAADGIFASGENVVVDNTGDIDASAFYWAAGIEAIGDVSVDASNHGSITATIVGDYNYGGQVNGIFAYGYEAAEVLNAGDITANAGNGYAMGMAVYSYGAAKATNCDCAVIDVNIDNGTAYGILAEGLDTTVVSDGSIDAWTGRGYATGIDAFGYDSVHVTSAATGSIVAIADDGDATGIFARGGTVGIDNAGDVHVEGNDEVIAIGAYGLFDDSTVSVHNSGALYAAVGGGKYGMVGGIVASAAGGVGITNDGDIITQGGIVAFGVTAQSSAGTTVTHDGSISVHYAVGMGAGILAQSNGGDVHVDGAGTIGVIAGKYGVGILAQADAGNADVDFAGDIDVSAYFAGFGIRATSEYGDAHITSDGAVTVDGNEYGEVTGLFAAAYGEASISNGGSVHATSVYGTAVGVYGVGETVVIDSAGDVTVSGGDVAVGIGAYGYSGATITNDGHVTVTQTGAGAYVPALVVEAGNAIGIGAYVLVGDASITNGGTVDVTAYDNATGIQALVHDGNVSVANTGAISAAATYGDAIGIDAVALPEYAPTSVTVGHDGDIVVTAEHHAATGVRAVANTVDIHGTGSITATGDGFAAGIDASGDDVTIVNDGSIHASIAGSGEYTGAVGIYAYGAASLVIGNGGDIVTEAAHAGAYGVVAYSYANAISVVNTGSISANGSTAASGIEAITQGTVWIGNGGDIVVESNAGAHGVLAYSYDNAISVVSGGSIAVTGGATALGIQAITQGDVSIENADMHVAAQRAIGVLAAGDTLQFANTGNLVVEADDNAAGVELLGAVSEFANGGSITATATADAANAIGVVLQTPSGVTAGNDGDIHASATGADGTATGLISFYGPGFRFDNSGSLTAEGGLFATGLDIVPTVDGIAADGDMAVHNTGLIGAQAGGAAFAVRLGNVASATIDNGGDIVAGADGHAVGVSVTSVGDIAIDNTGHIEASGPSAIALDLAGDAGIVIANTGTLLANGALEHSWAIVGDAGQVDVHNGGDVIGAVKFAGGDDRFANDGTWIVRGNGTDFGAGDDHLRNGVDGTILLEDASISLGSNSAHGNAFDNAGTLAVFGDSFIDMGTGADPVVAAANAAPIDVLNPTAFTNTGTITFLDGAPDDVLTIAGDFAGEGAINLDVSMLNGAADMLYVDGNIADGTVQALNVNILDMPNAAGGVDVPVVVVQGESQEGQFVAGTFTVGDVVFSPSNFLDLGVDVVHHADAPEDIFSLELTFDGINDYGSLAASIAPGAQSLMAAQVGTFRQRMGVFKQQQGNGDAGAWVRVYSDKGTLDPDAVMDNLPQGGNFAFEQHNTGVEAGYMAHITDGVYVGASLATGKGKQSLETGVGNDDIDGDTLGAHLVWLGTNGMYADLSYRWMHFDAELTSVGGRQTVGGDAGALNLEAGWNVWTQGEDGLKLVPQVQYTRTNVSNIDPVRGDLTDFTTDGVTSSRLRAGLELQQTFAMANGTWTPYGTLSAIREFEGESRFAIADTFTGHTSTEGTSGMLELGASVNTGRLSVWGGLHWIDGGAIDGVLGGQVGLRYTW